MKEDSLTGSVGDVFKGATNAAFETKAQNFLPDDIPVIDTEHGKQVVREQRAGNGLWQPYIAVIDEEKKTKEEIEIVYNSTPEKPAVKSPVVTPPVFNEETTKQFVQDLTRLNTVIAFENSNATFDFKSNNHEISGQNTSMTMDFDTVRKDPTQDLTRDGYEIDNPENVIT